MVHHLIVGGGPAAINAIETLRECDGGSSQITLVCDEPAYSRMVLPYYLADQIPRQQVFTANDEFFTRNGVTRRIGVRVTKLDPAAKQVALSDGQSLGFDDLLIATGSSPAAPPIPGADLPGVLPLWTLAQTEAVLEATKGLARPEVVLVGAGFIGFIVLNAMFKRGWKLHVVEQAPQVLPRMLNADAAKLVGAWLAKKGVGVNVGTTVQAVEADGPRKRVRLANGQSLAADLVILATGVRPNVDLAAGSGLSVQQGLVVNDRMQTNVPYIYAAGDVAQGPDLLGGTAVHAIQPTAVDHGRVSGANMAGQDVRYPGSLLMNILDVCGLQCASFGRWQSAAGAEAMTINNPDRPVFRQLIWSGDQVVGASFVGPATEVGLLNDVGMVKGIIQTRTPLGEWKKFLKENPFDIRRPYVAAEVGRRLVGTTLLGRPSKPRQFRFNGEQPGPQVTRPDAHRAFVENKA
jgi:NAD(P)H-nitrite reductase large subunit